MTHRWAFASEADKVIRGFDAKGRIEVDDEPYRGIMEHQAVLPGLSLFRGLGVSENAYSLTVQGEMPSDNLILGCLLGGSGTLEAEGNDDLTWRQTDQLYAVSLSQRQISYHMQPGQPFNALALMLKPEALDVLASDGGLPELVEQCLRAQADPVALMRPLSGQARQTAHDLLYPVYQGRMGELYRQAKALQLLALQLDGVGEMEVARQESVSSREMLRLREARERLLADLTSPPDLAELAASVGLSPKRLNLGFRAAFGTTVFDYLAEARLQMARNMLEEGLDMPLKALAWQIGYSQASNFINAFRRRFGVSPGAYRNGRGDRRG
ncbi:MAG TPA: AraC family transcriptional regulator [Devosia sp.]|jgi:AraC-like DNA-binding protein|nr:AraC family transcriptional regulator [Devosia sp.]